MIRFIINDTVVETDVHPWMSLLDFIRNEMGLPGTKCGCREGDCGACTVLIGEMGNNFPDYKAVVSCLTPVGNVSGKHVVTIEGLNCKELTPVQKTITEHSATQCGFCTPGFIVSLTGFLLSGDFSRPDNIIRSVDGNICRCTGYKSIERAAGEIYGLIPSSGRHNIPWLVAENFLPEYFLTIPGRLLTLGPDHPPVKKSGLIVGGGTDLMVQKPDELYFSDPGFSVVSDDLKYILVEGSQCTIGGATTVGQMMENKALSGFFPELSEYFGMISSTPVRNMATLAGNLINASPIADLAIFFLALDSMVVLNDIKGEQRKVALKQFFTGYRKTDKLDNEWVREICFRLPDENERFNFEKVSKRQHLDIASVNSAMMIRVGNNRIEKVHLSVGGVSPIPLYLHETCRFLTGKELQEETLLDAIGMISQEIMPISDIRGSGNYKRLLCGQLFLAHFYRLFPGLVTESLLFKIRNYNEKQ